MEDISIGSVVLTRFPFSDLSSKKVRPCLVVGKSDFNDFIVCQITSQPFGHKNCVEISSADFVKGRIVRTSYARPDKLATLDKDLFKNVLGAINQQKMLSVKKRLKKVFALD